MWSILFGAAEIAAGVYVGHSWGALLVGSGVFIIAIEIRGEIISLKHDFGELKMSVSEFNDSITDAKDEIIAEVNSRG